MSFNTEEFAQIFNALDKETQQQIADEMLEKSPALQRVIAAWLARHGKTAW